MTTNSRPAGVFQRRPITVQFPSQYDASQLNELVRQLNAQADTSPMSAINFVNTTPSGYTPYTLALLVDTTAGNITINLPPAMNIPNQVFYIKNYAGSNNVIVVPNGTDTIDGTNASITLTPLQVARMLPIGTGVVLL